MTLIIDLPPETEAWLQSEAASRGQAAEEYAREAFQSWLRLEAGKEDSEEAAFQDMRAISLPTLEEYWINDEDAVYDTL